jgi:hypothetical protein
MPSILAKAGLAVAAATDSAKCAQFSNGLNVGLYWHRP